MAKKKAKNRRPQTPKGRNLPTSGYGLHDSTLKDAEQKARGWKPSKELLDEIENWKDYV